ncbi:MAG TPA: Holliday junction resolvase RuvX [Alphaproteobacteria bacterium]|nr:Holliday junction resolvase RuvX [Alphaproteobacteria bacterium]
MPLLDYKNIPQKLIKQNAVLGIDYGTKKIGVAISDRSWMIASPYKLVRNTKFTNVAKEIFQMVDDEKIELIVIGNPIYLDNVVSKMQQSSRQFGMNLTKLRDINIVFYDERFTSIMAKEAMVEQNLNFRRRLQKVDKVAATFMLQRFLDYIEKQK